MAGPYDYTVQQPDITGSLMGGIKAGMQIGAARDAKAAAADYSNDLHNTLTNPTPQGFAALIAKYPQQREAFKESWGILNKDQQDQQFGAGTQAISAIQNGKPDVAIGILDKQIAALENSGQDPSNLISIRDAAKRDPKGAMAQMSLSLSSFDPDRWAKIAGEMRESELAPSQLTESQAKASKAATDAKFAESKAVQDLTKGGWQIQKLANDINISRQNSQIAALNANIGRETNDLKRQELGLKLQEKMEARDAKINEKVAEVSSARATIDNMLSTADRVLNTPKDIVGSAAGPISSKTPTLTQDTADFEELVNTLSSQAFMAQIPALKGMGALSNAEGEKLQSSLQNLSLRQSPERLLQNVQEAQRLIIKSRENLSTKFGVPDVTPDRPEVRSQPESSGFKVLGRE